MTRIASPPMPAEVRPARLPQQLRQRLNALGVCLLRLDSSGQTRILGPSQWIERILTRSTLFRGYVRRQWSALEQCEGQAVELWPGVWLAPLSPKSSPMPSPQGARRTRLAAMMLGTELLDSDQLRNVCDQRQLDLRAVIAQIDPQTLIVRGQASRMASMLTWMYQDIAGAHARGSDLRRLSRELTNTYEELSLLYKLSAHMDIQAARDASPVNCPHCQAHLSAHSDAHTAHGGPAIILEEACGELREVVGLEWLTLQFIEDETRLHNLSGYIVTAGDVNCPLDDLKNVGKALLERFADADEPMLINGAQSLGIPMLNRLARDMLIVPLRGEKRTVGLLFGGDRNRIHQITSYEAKLCDSLAKSLTIFLQNMTLYEDLQAMFLGAMHALTTAIDAKDSYTHGHSERVALMAKHLAQAVGLDAYRIERVYLSGMMHDVGKIGVPEAVLTKPGKLTKEEFDLIKLHPEIGARILEDIRQMDDLVPGVLYHHERWDGKGYPHGLAGEDIPLFGRLIGLADSFDAMSSNRSYRSAMEHQQVLQEIEDCRGKQFDPQFARVFVKLDFTPYHEMLHRHQHELG